MYIYLYKLAAYGQIVIVYYIYAMLIWKLYFTQKMSVQFT